MAPMAKKGATGGWTDQRIFSHLICRIGQSCPILRLWRSVIVAKSTLVESLEPVRLEIEAFGQKEMHPCGMPFDFCCFVGRAAVAVAVIGADSSASFEGGEKNALAPCPKTCGNLEVP
jgi:hypothetical protein